VTPLLDLRGLLDPTAAAGIAASLADAPFADGGATASGRAREAKHNLQLPPTHPRARAAGARILEALARNEAFRAFALPRAILPFTFARYRPGMAYGAHVDLPLVGTEAGPLRTDLSLSVFLSRPEDYDGGALVVPADSGERRIRGALGDAVVYPSDTVHAVEPITRGERLVAITWVQSLVRDPGARAIVAELAGIEADLREAGAPDDACLRLAAVQGRLLRRWVET
jgi:PKHD-type hydroxylase